MNSLHAYFGQTGLSSVGYRFFNSAEAALGSRVTSGIAEGAAGWYTASGVSIPAGATSVRWDDAVVTDLIAVEYFDPRLPNIAVGNAGSVLTSGTGASQLNVSGGNVAGSVSSVSAPVSVASMAAGSITAASLAGDAAVEIAMAVDAELTAGHGGGSWQTNDIGAGSFAATLTVTDGAAPVQGASVRVTSGPVSRAAFTDADGHVTFALDAGSYLVTISKPGYSSAPVTRTLSGNQSGSLVGEYELIPAGSIELPADASKCRVYAYLRAKSGEPARHVELSATLDTAPAVAGSILLASSIKTFSDADGYAELDLYRTDGIVPDSARWILEIPAAGYSRTTSLTTGTLDLGTLVT